jgi:hypothetical protein
MVGRPSKQDEPHVFSSLIVCSNPHVSCCKLKKTSHHPSVMFFFMFFQSKLKSEKLPKILDTSLFRCIFFRVFSAHGTLLGFQVDAAQRRRRLLASREDSQSGRSHERPGTIKRNSWLIIATWL